MMTNYVKKLVARGAQNTLECRRPVADDAQKRNSKALFWGVMAWRNYFGDRGLDSEHYRDFQIPPFACAVLPKDKGSAILDYGCGLGQWMVALREKGYQNVEGVDLSEEGVRQGKQRDLRVRQIRSVRDLARGGRRFDLVLMNHVLEHLPKEEVIECLRILRLRVLKPKGALLLTVPNGQSATGAYWAFEDFTHETLFTSGSIAQVLRAAGFERIEFLDPDNIQSTRPWLRPLRAFLLGAYKRRVAFRNWVTHSSFHAGSRPIFGFEIRVLAS